MPILPIQFNLHYLNNSGNFEDIYHDVQSNPFFVPDNLTPSNSPDPEKHPDIERDPKSNEKDFQIAKLTLQRVRDYAALLREQYLLQNPQYKTINNVPRGDIKVITYISPDRQFIFEYVPLEYLNAFNKQIDELTKYYIDNPLHKEPNIEKNEEANQYSDDALRYIEANSSGLYGAKSIHLPKGVERIKTIGHALMHIKKIESEAVKLKEQELKNVLVDQKTGNSEFKQAYKDWMAQCVTLKQQKQSELDSLILRLDEIETEAASIKRQIKLIESKYKASPAPKADQF